MNTFPLTMYEFLSYTGLARRNTVFIFLWPCPRNTRTSIQHLGCRQNALAYLYIEQAPQ